jgi:hypothetical protein
MNITLDELAWFNRCFFPADLEEGLKKHARFLSDYSIEEIVKYYKKEYKGGIIHLYQEYISWKEVANALEQIFQENLQKLKEIQLRKIS